MKTIYPNKIKDEFDLTNEEKIHTTEEIVNDYIYRCLEAIDRAALDKYLNTYGDPTNRLWKQIETLCSNLVLSLERTIETNDLEYSNFVIKNINQFLTKDENYRQQNQEEFLLSLNLKELRDEAFACELLGLRSQTKDVETDLEKIKSNYYFNDTEEVVHCIVKDYVVTYGDAVGKLFTNLEIFHSQLLSIFENVMKIKEGYYVKFVSDNIKEFLIGDKDYLKFNSKGVSNEF